MTSETGNRWQSNWPLEEWRHWLDGAQSQFRCPGKNAGPYSSKDLTLVTYRPGSKNTKAGALSHQYSSETDPIEPKPILPPGLFMRPILWEINVKTRMKGVPEERMFIPLEHRLSVDVHPVQSQTPRHLPVDKLMAFPLPLHPWSQVMVDFLTDLHLSDN